MAPSDIGDVTVGAGGPPSAQPASVPVPHPVPPATYAWLIVVTPLAFGLLDCLLGVFRPGEAAGAGTNAAYCGVLVFASWKDAKQFDGELRNPRRLWLKAWIILTPVYLIQRARILGHGWRFLVLFLASVVAGALIGAAPTLLSPDTYWGAGVPACDGAYSHHMVRSIIDDAQRRSPLTRDTTTTAVRNTRETGFDGGRRSCLGEVVLSDQSATAYAYTIERRGDQVLFQLRAP